MGLFRRNRKGPPTPEEMLAEGRGDQQASDDGVPSDLRMVVEDVFSITGRGMVVTGQVAAGSVSTGAYIGVWRDDTLIGTFQVKGVEAFRKKITRAGVGESIGLLLEYSSRHELRTGDVVRAD